ncbi:MarR family winged helix-turn-helix transcriptional regulator [Reichenbachiella versicolor]|uniref:MarR family winged helix-turn-helix transcriptional regulator n=1 Tax=Reichenbachiella versicolor TaxID=1821036 RepID=UPI000D6E463A|nr:MarR family transcriptional regulator [Reichenbachiella versicolor]
MGLAEDIKSSSFESYRAKALVNILYTSNYFRDVFKSHLKKFNLQHQHYNVLRIINGKYPEPISPGQIKEVMLDKGPDVTRLVDKLVKLGLVDRCLSESNRRMVEIKMTEKGREFALKLIEDGKAITDKSMGLSEEEAQQLSDLLDKARTK